MNAQAERRSAYIADANARLPRGAHISWEPLTMRCKRSKRPFRLYVMGQLRGCFASLKAAEERAVPREANAWYSGPQQDEMANAQAAQAD